MRYGCGFVSKDTSVQYHRQKVRLKLLLVITSSKIHGMNKVILTVLLQMIGIISFSTVASNFKTI